MRQPSSRHACHAVLSVLYLAILRVTCHSCQELAYRLALLTVMGVGLH